MSFDTPHATVTANGATVNGNFNKVLGSFCSVRGSHCEVRGNRCEVYGHHCVVYGDNCVIHGHHCTVYGNNCEVHGHHARIHNVEYVCVRGHHATGNPRRCDDYGLMNKFTGSDVTVHGSSDCNTTIHVANGVGSMIGNIFSSFGADFGTISGDGGVITNTFTRDGVITTIHTPSSSSSSSAPAPKPVPETKAKPSASSVTTRSAAQRNTGRVTKATAPKETKAAAAAAARASSSSSSSAAKKPPTITIEDLVAVDDKDIVLIGVDEPRTNYPAARDAVKAADAAHECCVCMSNEKDTIVLDCGHVCMCTPCARALMMHDTTGGANAKCPKCRANIREIRNVFF